MKRILCFFLFALAGCAHSPPPGQELVPGLALQGNLRETRWIRDSRDGASAWKSPEGILLSIGNTEAVSPNEAKVKMSSKRRALQQFLEAQVDPYYGSLQPNAACDLAGLGMANVQREGSSLRFQVSLGADRDLQLECYGSEEPEYVARVLLLYCSKNSSLYELKHFTPFRSSGSTSGLDPLPVSCR